MSQTGPRMRIQPMLGIIGNGTGARHDYFYMIIKSLNSKLEPVRQTAINRQDEEFHNSGSLRDTATDSSWTANTKDVFMPGVSVYHYFIIMWPHNQVA